MSDFTPDTDEVRDTYKWSCDGREIDPAPPSPDELEAEFDRWLEQHDKERDERIITKLEAWSSEKCFCDEIVRRYGGGVCTYHGILLKVLPIIQGETK